MVKQCKLLPDSQSKNLNITFKPEDSGYEIGKFVLIPRVVMLFGQQLFTRRDAGELEFYFYFLVAP